LYNPFDNVATVLIEEVSNAIPSESTSTTDEEHICTMPGCNKKFKRIDNLNKHIQAHPNVKSYACSFPNCSYASARRYNTIRHIPVHFKYNNKQVGAEDPWKYLIVKQ